MEPFPQMTEQICKLLCPFLQASHLQKVCLHHHVMLPKVSMPIVAVILAEHSHMAQTFLEQEQAQNQRGVLVKICCTVAIKCHDHFHILVLLAGVVLCHSDSSSMASLFPGWWLPIVSLCVMTFLWLLPGSALSPTIGVHT